MTAALLQLASPFPSIDVEPLLIYISPAGAFLKVTAPSNEAAAWVFEYLTERRELEGYRFGSVGQNNPTQPVIVWIRAHRRSRWFRERIWTAAEVEEEILKAWEEVGGQFTIPYDPAPLPPPAPPVALVPGQKAPLWNEEQMAAAMGIEPHVLHERLERGVFWYKYTHRAEKWQPARESGVLKDLTHHYTYLFDEKAQAWNRNHVNRTKPRKRAKETEEIEQEEAE